MAEAAYETIEELIVTCVLKPGGMISESYLCHELDMGRAPIREALARLKQIGFVEVHHRRGVLVSRVDVIRHLELLEVRRPLEECVVRKAATRAKEDDLNEPRETACKLEEAANRGDRVGYFRLTAVARNSLTRIRHTYQLSARTSRLFLGRLPRWLKKGLSGRWFAAVTKFAQTMPHLLLAIVASMVLIVTVSGSESRADWPEHPITVIVPFAPGGVTDLIGRLLATELTQRLRTNVSVQNRAGEVGRVALRDVAMAAPNGYTLLVTTNAVLINLIINPNLSKTHYDVLKDFAPIAHLGSTPLVIVTRPSSGIGSIADLIAKAKANPGKLSCASVGAGSPSGIVLALLKIRAGIDITDTPFDGNELAMIAAITGATDVASLGLGGSINHIRSGELKALAQTGSDRWVDLPDVPTMVEAGIPNTVVETSLMFRSGSDARFGHR